METLEAAAAVAAAEVEAMETVVTPLSERDSNSNDASSDSESSDSGEEEEEGDEGDWESDLEGRCCMCGKKGAIMLRAWSTEWAGMNRFCEGEKGQCVKQFARYVSSGRTNLSNGCPYMYVHDPRQRIDEDIDPVTKKEKREGLVCCMCGERGEKVIRNFGLPETYWDKDFCFDSRCCERYKDYVDYVGYIVDKHDVSQPVICNTPVWDNY
jgi:hypothetical protein